MTLQQLTRDLDALIANPAELRMEAVMLEALATGGVTLEDLEEYVAYSDSYYLAEAGFLTSLKRAARKVIKRVKRAVKSTATSAKKKFSKVARALGITSKPKGSSCKPGEKMVFGVCRPVGGSGSSKRAVDPGPDGELDATKSTAWYKKQAAAHKALSKDYGDKLTQSWRDPDANVPVAHLNKSVSHHKTAQDYEKMAKMTPAQRKEYAASRRSEKQRKSQPSSEVPPTRPGTRSYAPSAASTPRASDSELKATAPARRKAPANVKQTAA